MCDQLRSLVNLASFQSLHDRLQKWSDSYMIHTCDQNVNNAIEVIELNSKLQSQLYNLLVAISQEGGTYGGCDPIKRKLLPWLAQGAGRSVSQDTSLKLINEASAKDREIREITERYEAKIENIESMLKNAKLSSGDLENELEDTKNELKLTKKAASGDLIATEDELARLRKDLREAQEEVRRMKNASVVMDDYEIQIRRLRNEIDILKDEKQILTRSSSKSHVDDDDYSAPLPAVATHAHDSSPSQIARQHSLVNQFSELYTRNRSNEMNTLRIYSDNNDRNQRILWYAVVESFREAKLAFRQYKLRVRKALLPHQSLDETLDESVQRYIDRHGEFHEVYGLKYFEVDDIVADVIRSLNRNPVISYAPYVDYYDIKGFIRKCVEIGWAMQCLHAPLDVHVGSDDELIKESSYRRSFDSDYTSYLVHHYIWPSLVDCRMHVLTKGECCTRKAGDILPIRSRSRSRSSKRCRSMSPRRSRYNADASFGIGKSVRFL